ncbi:30S ribosomal protein S8 [Candidatus Kuenenbacteria bacterium CG08_land_8_20_14_0_20_37_23]|uniref:Small ribosomal subunit protein uS8 n=1 Tax=Candidatus Kuenenbacteria bacterium CG08_land_8_20_14_0_20_37_23 TaxID=1974617 RepID=A0A2M6XRP8_9BACT|nr:MAG: 30S ribosomal protein S8 [Candidatus Kuenenbacteria bacterium CG08_land_8_20_14_0_20_37_23]
MRTDPIADMLTRIRNAQAVKKAEVVLPYSKLKMSILNLFEEEGWIAKVENNFPGVNQAKSVVNNKDALAKFASIKVIIKYDSDGTPKISSINRISKPGKRVYADKDNIPVVLNYLGMAIISTSQGLMTDKEARKKKIGGEVICEIY